MEFEPFISEYNEAEANGDLNADRGQADRYDIEPASAAFCPFCQAEETCAHHLLSVDLVFRGTCGGALNVKFSERCLSVFEVERAINASDFDERPAVDQLLAGVEALADADRDFELEAGPGQSTTYRNYYCSSAERTAAAVASF